MMTARKIRWWPGLLLSLAAFGTLLWIWGSSPDSSEQIRQSKVMMTMALALVWSALVAFWLLFFARIGRAGRLRLVAVAALVFGAFFGLFRYRGVDGDLVPQFSLRFGADRLDLGDSGRTLEGVSDSPQFLGPGRNARIGGISLARDWQARPPRLLWRRPVGAGWAGFAVAKGIAVTQEQHEDEEWVVAYALESGERLWFHAEKFLYDNAIAGRGPRATPTVTDGVAFSMGATGLLTAIDAQSGSLIWKANVIEDHDARLPEWGKSNSPLVDEERVYVSAGGSQASLVAYDRRTGEVVASGGSDPSGYASPMRLTLEGVDQIVQFNANSVVGHDSRTLQVLWRTEWPPRQPNVAQPLFIPPDRLLASAGYGIGSKLYRLSVEDDTESFQVEELWESRRLKAKFTNLVLHEGYVYGLDDGVLVCLDPETGERMWKKGRYGHGQVLLVDELLLLQAEQGAVFLIDPSPDGLVELGSFQALDAKTWNTPTLAGKYLLVRNDQEAALYELPVGP